VRTNHLCVVCVYVCVYVCVRVRLCAVCCVLCRIGSVQCVLTTCVTLFLSKVTKLILIERDVELVAWLMPRLRRILNPWLLTSLDVHVGDAFETLPLVTADVALVDIFPDYGGSESRRQLERLRRVSSSAVKEVVGWGVT
jgi:hypothetical protein